MLCVMAAIIGIIYAKIGTKNGRHSGLQLNADRFLHISAAPET